MLGLYHANERLDDAEFGPGARKIADKLQQQCHPLAAGLLVRSHAWRCRNSFMRRQSNDVLLSHGSVHAFFR